MKLVVIAFGKLRTPGLRLAGDHYLKGLRYWHAFEEIELKPIAVADKSAESRRLVQTKEEELFVAAVAKVAKGSLRLALLDESGSAQTSEGWASLLQKCADSGTGTLVFGIGSSLGFSASLKAKADEMLSLGPQTYPHELARVALFEQLFRAASINNNHPYHVEG